jgi:hypothetical protein
LSRSEDFVTQNTIIIAIIDEAVLINGIAPLATEMTETGIVGKTETGIIGIVRKTEAIAMTRGAGSAKAFSCLDHQKKE